MNRITSMDDVESWADYRDLWKTRLVAADFWTKGIGDALYWWSVFTLISRILYGSWWWS